MMHFAYTRAGTVAEAARLGAASGVVGDAAPAAAFIAGGTNLIDLAKADVIRPRRLVDLTRLPLKEIADLPDGGLRLGALATNADTAHDARVVARYPLLSRAILAGASAQLRNVATNGGNLLQRTRCYYFYDYASPCNKRQPGAGCAALGGVNRLHAILGASDHCIATHPSDMCVALAALAAVVQVSGVDGDRTVPFADLHRLPGDSPEVDHTLRPGEVITAIDLPPAGFAGHSTYLKVRDRASYAFAVVSAAAALDLDGDTIRAARLALGGLAHKPWRDEAAEALLVGRPATAEAFRAAADHVLRDARGHEHNAFKIPLARNVIVKALEQATRGA